MAKKRRKRLTYSQKKKDAAVAAYWAMESFDSIERRLKVRRAAVIYWALANGAAPRSSKGRGFVPESAPAAKRAPPVSGKPNARKFCKPAALAVQ